MSPEVPTNSPTLDYASSTTPRKRQWSPYQTAFIGIAAIALAAALLPSHFGSGVSRPNPLRVLVMCGVFLSGVAYVAAWARRDGLSWLTSGLLAVFCGAFWFLLAVQLHVIWNDPGHPLSRFRTGNLVAGGWAVVSIVAVVATHLLSQISAVRRAT